jgi:hypothetical protein
MGAGLDTYQGGPRQFLPSATSDVTEQIPTPRAMHAVLHMYYGGQRQDLPSGQSKHLR